MASPQVCASSLINIRFFLLYLIISQMYCFKKNLKKRHLSGFFIFLFLLRGHIEVIYLNCFSGDDVHPPLCLRLSSAQYIFFPFLLTESVAMALNILASNPYPRTKLLHHPSIVLIVQQPPHQNPNLTG